jgi:hypothetical protein
VVAEQPAAVPLPPARHVFVAAGAMASRGRDACGGFARDALSSRREEENKKTSGHPTQTLSNALAIIAPIAASPDVETVAMLSRSLLEETGTASSLISSTSLTVANCMPLRSITGLMPDVIACTVPRRGRAAPRRAAPRRRVVRRVRA